MINFSSTPIDVHVLLNLVEANLPKAAHVRQSYVPSDNKCALITLNLSLKLDAFLKTALLFKVASTLIMADLETTSQSE